jgi:hypothetical protein
MSEPDAKVLMVAAQNVMRHYSIAATQKAVDWMTFASVATFMYAPRAVALRTRMRRPGPDRRSPLDGADQPPAGPAQVFTFRPSNGPPPNHGAQQPPIIDMPAGVH